jgi:hypothetical protein
VYFWTVLAINKRLIHYINNHFCYYSHWKFTRCVCRVAAQVLAIVCSSVVLQYQLHEKLHRYIILALYLHILPLSCYRYCWHRSPLVTPPSSCYAAPARPPCCLAACSQLHLIHAAQRAASLFLFAQRSSVTFLGVGGVYTWVRVLYVGIMSYHNSILMPSCS